MYCPSCGKQVSDYENFCSYCGSKLKDTRGHEKTTEKERVYDDGWREVKSDASNYEEENNEGSSQDWEYHSPGEGGFNKTEDQGGFWGFIAKAGAWYAPKEERLKGVKNIHIYLPLILALLMVPISFLGWGGLLYMGFTLPIFLVMLLVTLLILAISYFIERFFINSAIKRAEAIVDPTDRKIRVWIILFINSLFSMLYTRGSILSSILVLVIVTIVALILFWQDIPQGNEGTFAKRYILFKILVAVIIGVVAFGAASCAIVSGFMNY